MWVGVRSEEDGVIHDLLLFYFSLFTFLIKPNRSIR